MLENCLKYWYEPNPCSAYKQTTTTPGILTYIAVNK